MIFLNFDSGYQTTVLPMRVSAVEPRQPMDAGGTNAAMTAAASRQNQHTQTESIAD
jgi:hypothetical protein